MSRRNQLNPMRFLVLLAVTWVAGTLLFAAEQTPRPTPGATAPAAATPAADTAEVSAGEAAESSAVAQARQTAETQEPAAEEPAAEEPTAEEAQAEEPTPNSAKDKSENAQRASAADKGSPKRFVPSEQVRADFDVSFPIDI